MVHTAGFTVVRPSTGDTVMTRAVKDGHAELIEGPNTEVYFRVIHGV